MSTRIVIFDDNKKVLKSTALLLMTDPSIEMVDVYNNTQNCINKIILSAPDIVLMDICMPDINGIESTKILIKQFPDLHILMYTVFDDDDRILEAICAGASGYLLKGQQDSSLIDAIKEVQTGGAPMSPSIARRVVSIMQHKYKNRYQSSKEYNLTSREKEVLQCTVNGLSYKMIGFELNISYETVRSHIKNIYKKLGVASLTEVVAKAINQNIV